MISMVEPVTGSYSVIQDNAISDRSTSKNSTSMPVIFSIPSSPSSTSSAEVLKWGPTSTSSSAISPDIKHSPVKTSTGTASMKPPGLFMTGIAKVTTSAPVVADARECWLTGASASWLQRASPSLAWWDTDLGASTENLHLSMGWELFNDGLELVRAGDSIPTPRRMTQCWLCSRLIGPTGL